MYHDFPAGSMPIGEFACELLRFTAPGTWAPIERPEPVAVALRRLADMRI